MNIAHLHKSVFISAFALSVCVGLFLYFGSRADAAMDKAGIGDLATWELYQTRAGFAFYTGLAVWSVSAAWAVRCKNPERTQLFNLCALTPFVMFAIVGLSLVVL
ncbi:MAG: hypothetical protein V4607_05155 [Pseudomonadota bacterium]